MDVPLRTAIMQDQYGELVLLFPQEVTEQFHLEQGMVVDLQAVEGKLMIFLERPGDAVAESSEGT